MVNEEQIDMAGSVLYLFRRGFDDGRITWNEIKCALEIEKEVSIEVKRVINKHQFLEEQGPLFDAEISRAARRRN